MRERVIKECRSDYHAIFQRYLALTILFLIGVLALRPSVIQFGLWFFAGFLAWNTIEYAIHRWSFHRNVEKAPWNHLTFGLHNYHHGNADELEYVPVPWRFSASVMTIVLSGIVILSQSLAALCSAGLAMGLSYLYFEWIHRRMHSVKPANELERRIQAFHLHHHYGSNRQNFGLTFPFIDMLLGTAYFGD